MERAGFCGCFVLTVVCDELKDGRIAARIDGRAGRWPLSPSGDKKLFMCESDCSPLLSLSRRFTGVNSWKAVTEFKG